MIVVYSRDYKRLDMANKVTPALIFRDKDGAALLGKIKFTDRLEILL